MNRYHIHYFGLLAERRGVSEESVTSETGDAAALFDEVCAHYPLGMDASAVRVAVNDEFAPWDRPLADGDHVAFLPPMSGG